MSGTFPATPVAASLSIGSIQPTLISVAQSLKRQVRTRGGQRWVITARWAPALRATFAPIFAFVLAQDGQWGTFQYVLPTWSTPQGSWPTATVIEVDGAGQTGTTLNIKTLTISQSNIAKAGDFFKIAGHSKVYQVTANANSNGAGKAALSIKPKLVTSPADGEDLTITGVAFTLALASDEFELPLRSPSAMAAGFELKMIEVY